jgi:hypothetical protein
MMPKVNTYDRKLRVETLEDRRLLAVYLQSAAADFVGDLPQNNPNGDWAYLGPRGLTADLEAHNDPGSVGGAGTGWRVNAAAGGGVLYSYSRGTNGGFSSEPNSILGHGPMKTVWTAPAEVDLWGVEITGLLTQADFEPTRQMRMQIFKNDVGDPFVTLDANFVDQRAIVPLPATQIAVEPGDTLTILVDGSGPLGNNTSTFASWDVTIEEFDPEIDADFNGNSSVDSADLAIWDSGYGLTGSATKSDGDANDDSNVDGSDFLMWQRQFGNSIDSGMPPSDYHPAAVIVQTTGVTLHDGTLLDITGTQTQGLQEAFDYAADEGWGVFVLPGTYNLNAHLDVVERQGAAFRLQDVTMNFGAGVTDYGLQFDSTMITDWYWDGGALIAASATDGVRIKPRNPHPLDGCLGLTPAATVDSRFIFDVPITAATNEVTMDSTIGTINDIYLHFQGLTENELNYIGGGFADSNTFVSARTDPAIPWDILTTDGRVTVNVPDGPIGTVATVYTPEGGFVDTSGTTTSGLQEAFDYAAANNLDVLVFGRGILNSEMNSSLPQCGNTNEGLYNLNTTLTVGSLNNRIYRIFNVTFNYTGASAAIEFNDVVSSDFELTGQVVGASANTGVLIKPLTTSLTDSTIRVEHVPISDSAGTTGVKIDPSLQTIENNDFFFTEVLGGDYGISVENPSASTFFRNNLLSTVHTHNFTTIGLSLGTTSTNSDNIHTNTVDVHTDTDGGPSETDLQVWGDNNTITFGARGGGLTGAASRLETTSANNVVKLFSVNGGLIDLGTNNSYVAALVAASSSGEVSSVSSESMASLAGFQLGIQEDVKQAPAVIDNFVVTTPISSEQVAADRDSAEQTTSARDAAFSDFSEDEAQPNFLIEAELSHSLAVDLTTI